MKRRVCLATAIMFMPVACLERPSERLLVASDAYPFAGAAEDYPWISTEQAETLAHGALMPGEQLSWFGPIALDGIGESYVLAAAIGPEGVSRGYAVDAAGTSIDQSELALREEQRQYGRFGKATTIAIPGDRGL